MSAYNAILTHLTFSETGVNCARCPSELKCCTYRPFIANFLAGRMLSEHGDLPLNDWDLLIVGLAPNAAYRRYFSKKGKWGFGEDSHLLCSFYDSSSGGCRVWSSRPAVCRTFYCKSAHGDTGMTYWNHFEEFTWLLEWVLLEDFLFAEGWTLDDLAVIKKYLHEEYLQHPFPLPGDYRFSTVEMAQAFYMRAAAHVKGLSAEAVTELLGPSGRVMHAELVAAREKFR